MVLDAAMRVPGKAVEVVLGNVIAEVVEQAEWVESVVCRSEGAAAVHARPSKGGFGLDEPLDPGEWT